MAPRTTMTPDHVAVNVEEKRKAWQQRTGLKLLVEDPAEAVRAMRRRARAKKAEENTTDEG